jgi:predicted Ser/Thr protein kinase/methylase of polypeptide subunit release factors
MTWPIAVISFNRPHLLEQVLRGLREQTSPPDPAGAYLFQDGGQHSAPECVGIFKKIFPQGRAFVADTKLGVGLNSDRAERFVFETLGAECGIFFEDDVLAGPAYLTVLNRLIELALADERIGYVAAYGNYRATPQQQLQNARKLRPLRSLLGIGLTKCHWLKCRPYMEQYLPLLHALEGGRPDRDAIRALCASWGVEPGDTGPDRVKAFVTAVIGAIKLNTEVAYGKHIGEQGMTFTPERFKRWGFADSQFFSEVQSLDFDLSTVNFDPWFAGNNVKKLASVARDELRRSPATAADVRQAYRLILGREPESRHIVQARVGMPMLKLRDALISSPEFLKNNKRLIEEIILPNHTGEAKHLPLSPISDVDGTLAENDQLPHPAAVPPERLKDRENTLFSLADTFATFPSPRDSAVDTASLRTKIQAMAADIQGSQSQYQPVFCFNDVFPPGPRNAHLSQTCELVAHHYAGVNRKQHIRILDVGCNTGFVTLTLAKTFPNVIGLDIGANYIDLATALADYSGSTARFFQADAVEYVASGALKPGIVDCALLLNVVHQIIFKYGLAYAQNIIGKLSKLVDVLFIELATADEYRKHDKHHHLPPVPAEVLASCTESDIRLLRPSPRPLFVITRRTNTYSELVESVAFSDNKNPAISRKYIYGPGTFTKFYRRSGAHDFLNTIKGEIAALYKVRDTGVAPRILDWALEQDTAWVKMERIYGPPLSTAIQQGFSSVREKQHIIKELLRIAVRLGECGIYQNDASPHNFVISSHLRLHVIDFEQARPRAVRDQFAFLLWTVNDLYMSRRESYELGVHPKLTIRSKDGRASRDLYPVNLENSFEGDTFMTDFLQAALIAPDWLDFARTWQKRFEQHIAAMDQTVP